MKEILFLVSQKSCKIYKKRVVNTLYFHKMTKKHVYPFNNKKKDFLKIEKKPKNRAKKVEKVYIMVYNRKCIVFRQRVKKTDFKCNENFIFWAKFLLYLTIRKY